MRTADNEIRRTLIKLEIHYLGPNGFKWVQMVPTEQEIYTEEDLLDYNWQLQVGSETMPQWTWVWQMGRYWAIMDPYCINVGPLMHSSL